MQRASESRLATTISVEVNVEFVLQARLVIKLRAGTNYALLDVLHIAAVLCLIIATRLFVLAPLYTLVEILVLLNRPVFMTDEAHRLVAMAIIAHEVDSGTRLLIVLI